ncbi:hypothetical protein [Thermococcus sp. 21S9]|uniref:hypothetical protein n=1 Tax=Thermococcus sp. 21S9 TaxID=1638223 RepID=UPI0014395C8F|nr:hypothetical protein [Thermococcus sp. 21S9]
MVEMAGNGKRIVKTKAIISSILIALYVGAVFLTISSAIAAHRGSFLGEPAKKLLQLHVHYGMVMLALIAIHLYLNWGMFKNELKVLRS